MNIKTSSGPRATLKLVLHGQNKKIMVLLPGRNLVHLVHSHLK